MSPRPRGAPAASHTPGRCRQRHARRPGKGRAGSTKKPSTATTTAAEGGERRCPPRYRPAPLPGREEAVAALATASPAKVGGARSDRAASLSPQGSPWRAARAPAVNSGGQRRGALRKRRRKGQRCLTGGEPEL